MRGEMGQKEDQPKNDPGPQLAARACILFNSVEELRSFFCFGLKNSVLLLFQV